MALFWGPKKVAPFEMTLSLPDFMQAQIYSEGDLTKSENTKKVSVSIVSSISEVSSEDMDACSLDATRPKQFNLFLTQNFLLSLEESVSFVKYLFSGNRMDILGVVPLYLKSHSYGEYVFDHSWADAYYSYRALYKDTKRAFYTLAKRD